MMLTWGFPKIRCTILGAQVERIIVFWGLDWSPLFRETTTSDMFHGPSRMLLKQAWGFVAGADKGAQ